MQGVWGVMLALVLASAEHYCIDYFVYLSLYLILTVGVHWFVV